MEIRYKINAVIADAHGRAEKIACKPGDSKYPALAGIFEAMVFDLMLKLHYTQERLDDAKARIDKLDAAHADR